MKANKHSKNRQKTPEQGDVFATSGTMKNLEQQLKKAREQVVFPPEKKAIMGTYLESQIDASVRKEAGSRLQGVGEGSILSLFILELKSIKITQSMAGLLIALLLSGGVSFAAEGSLPGEVLYPVKVNVNEQVRAAASFTTESKAEWDARRAERRLEEAEELSARGELDAETQAFLSSKFKSHADRFETRLEKIRAKGEADAEARIASGFEAQLSAHERVLGKLSTTAGASMNTAAEIRGDVRLVGNAVSLLRSNAEARIRTMPSFDGRAAAEAKLKVAERSIAEAEQEIAQRGFNLAAESSTESTVAINSSLTAAKEAVITGRGALEAGQNFSALTHFQTAARLAQEAKVFAHASAASNVDAGVTINSNTNEGETSNSTSTENTESTEGSGGVEVEVEAGAEVKVGI